MTRTYNYILGLLLIFALASCALDNYEPPKSFLKGRLVYNGEPVMVGDRQVEFRAVEPGYARVNPLPIYVAEDGSFSTLFFDSTYKLYFLNGEGPFKPKLNPETQSDTIIVSLQGSKTMDIEVTPYYMVRNPQFSYDKAAKTVTATLKVEQIITGAGALNVESVVITLHKTSLINGREDGYRDDEKKWRNSRTTSLSRNDIATLDNVSITGILPDYYLPSQNYVYARVGVKIVGLNDMVFSPVQKIELQ